VAVLLSSIIILALAFIHNSGSQTTFQYDPWADINDDGYIDVKDISYTCRLFGTTGDPTKNVNITNWMPKQPQAIFYGRFNVSWSSTGATSSPMVGAGFFNVNDYDKIYVYAIYYNPTNGKVALRTLIAIIAEWSIYGDYSVTYWGEIVRGTAWDFSALAMHGITKQGVISVKAPYVQLTPFLIDWDHDNSGSCIVDIYVYLAYGELSEYDDLRLNTMTWRRRMEGLYTSTLQLGPYDIKGIRTITIWMYATKDLTIWIGYSNDDSIGQINYIANTRIARTYDVHGSQVCIVISNPSAYPWDFDFTVTLAP
jgi:hypothetical protein